MAGHLVEDPVFRTRYRFTRSTDPGGGEVQHVEMWIDPGGGVPPHLHPTTACARAASDGAGRPGCMAYATFTAV